MSRNPPALGGTVPPASARGPDVTAANMESKKSCGIQLFCGSGMATDSCPVQVVIPWLRKSQKDWVGDCLPLL